MTKQRRLGPKALCRVSRPADMGHCQEQVPGQVSCQQHCWPTIDDKPTHKTSLPGAGTEHGAQSRVPSSRGLSRLFSLVGAPRAQLCPSLTAPLSGVLSREGCDQRQFYTENGFPLTAQSRPEVPRGAKEARAGQSPGGRWARTSGCCTGSRQGHRSTGGLRPLQPLQSGSFQFQSHETHVAAGMRGSSVTTLCVHYVNKKQ